MPFAVVVVALLWLPLLLPSKYYTWAGDNRNNIVSFAVVAAVALLQLRLRLTRNAKTAIAAVTATPTARARAAVVACRIPGSDEREFLFPWPQPAASLRCNPSPSSGKKTLFFWPGERCTKLEPWLAICGHEVATFGPIA